VGNICEAEALDEKASAATIGFGMEAIAGGVDLLCLSAMGKGSIVGNLALAQLLFGKSIVQDAGPRQVWDLAQEVVQLHESAAKNPLEAMRKIGGREHSAIAGAILAARTSHVPVILDGLTAIVVAGLLERQQKGSCAHCRLSTNGQSGLYHRLSNEIGIEAILDKVAPANDAASGALALAHVKSLAAIHHGVVINID